MRGQDEEKPTTKFKNIVNYVETPLAIVEAVVLTGTRFADPARRPVSANLRAVVIRF